MGRRRVLLVVTGFPIPTQRNRGIFSLRSARQLAEFADLEVLFLRGWMPGREINGRDRMDGIPVRTVAFPQLPWMKTVDLALADAFLWPTIRSAIQETDLVHTVGADFAGRLGAIWARRAGRPHVLQITGGDVNETLITRRGRSFPYRWSRHVHAVAAVSHALARRFTALLPHVPNVHVVYRGTDLSRFKPPADPEGSAPREQGVRFLFLGGVPPSPYVPHDLSGKRGRLVLDVWRRHEGQFVELGAELVVAGSNSTTGWVRRLRNRLSVPGRVQLRGAVPPEDVPVLLRSCDVVLLPSVREGLPNVAVESAAAGRPMIASAVGGIPEVVVHGETGLLVDPEDSREFATAMIDVARHRYPLRQWGSAARRRAETIFDDRQFAPRMREVYDSALAAFRGDFG